MNVLRSILLSKDNLLDAMERMLDDLGNIHKQDNFYERMFSMKKQKFTLFRILRKCFWEGRKISLCLEKMDYIQGIERFDLRRFVI